MTAARRLEPRETVDVVSPRLYRLVQAWTEVRSGFWFVPGLVVLCTILLALALIEADGRLGEEWQRSWPRLFGGGADGSRGMLSAIATSMITVAGVIFAITIAALSQASQQYTPRILRTFMRDRGNQLVLGVFTGVFAYCLVVLRTIRGGDESIFVPGIAVLTGFALALVGIAFLIYFIHHVATFLQADHIIAEAAHEAMAAACSVYTGEPSSGCKVRAGEDEEATAEGRRWYFIPARETGYIQSMRTASMVEIARKHDIVVQVDRHVGDFAIAELPIASAAMRDGPDAALIEALRDSFVIAEYRTVEQDPAFAIRLIVDMAVKALSPGINDPTTASTCIHYLTAIIAHLADRELSPHVCDEDGKVRVIHSAPDFQDLIHLAFDQIRSNAAREATLLEQMADSLATIARQTSLPARRAVAIAQLHHVAQTARRCLEDEVDRTRVLAKVDAATNAARDGHGGAKQRAAARSEA